MRLLRDSRIFQQFATATAKTPVTSFCATTSLSALSSASLPVPSKQEPRYDYDPCKNAQRPDAVFFHPLDAIEVGVSITSSRVPSNMLATVKAGGSALLKRESVKNTVRRRASGATALVHLFSRHKAALVLMFELSCAC